ncbi:uncharacterized protein LOC117911766 [Vitis riparia]|uniref:uncharacterized protein LOC117911766 n=1 Tax=Vitis riparia TaxID=96939 RepID=UPI00155A3643|nr:uncharacterized protein LOC117911766 [Vitis riparia]
MKIAKRKAIESPLAFLAIFSLLLLASVEARKHPGEDWSKGPATLREKQSAMVESADYTMKDQTSTLFITIEENCGEAKDSPVVERGASKEEGTINLPPFLAGETAEDMSKERINDSVDYDKDLDGPAEKFSLVFDPRTDVTIYHE